MIRSLSTGLTRALVQEGKDKGILVNAIAPIAVTRMIREVFFGGAASESDDWQSDIRKGVVPMGPPVAASPTVLWLTHRDTDIDGEIFNTSSGKVARRKLRAHRNSGRTCADSTAFQFG